MGSTRLPGKVLQKVLDKSLLEYQLERLARAGEADELVVATTVNPIDQPIVDLCDQHGVAWFRGDEEDVLDRYYRAALERGADAVVRVTSDCPLIDPAVVDGVVRAYRDNSEKVDYVANTLQRTYPRGMDCEIFSSKVLAEAEQHASGSEREHVTMYIYRRPERYRLLNVSHSTDESQYRWTVDTPEDFELIRRMIEALYPESPRFTLEDCLSLIKAHPGWSQLNQHIRQKA